MKSEFMERSAPTGGACDGCSHAPPSSEEWRIRDATHADLPAIVAIDRASFAQPWLPRSFERALRDEKTIALVAQAHTAITRTSKATTGEETTDGEIIGYGIAYTVGDEGEIATLAVAASARGRGLGAALLRTLLRRCAAQAGARQVFLEVRAGNVAAQRLYERCGFAPAGLRRRYYADGEDAILMRTTL